MYLGMMNSPTMLGGGAASYKLWPVFTYSNGYWEVYRRFQGDFILFWGWGWGEEAMLEDLSLEESVMEEEVFKEKGSWFSSITIRKQWKINMKRFFQMKGRISIETWNEQSLLRIWGVLKYFSIKSEVFRRR